MCVKCHGHETVNNGKLEDVHGVYVKIAPDELAISPDFVALDQSCVVPVPQTPEQMASRACPEKECTLCEAIIPAHGNIVEKEVLLDDITRKCTATRKVVDTCEDCLAIVSDVREIAPTGHTFDLENIVEVNYVPGADSYTVELTCTECAVPYSFTATLNAEKSVEQTCKQGGFDIYTIEYDTFAGCEVEELVGTGVATIDTDKKNETDGPSTEHTFVFGETELKVDPTLGTVQYDPSKAEALDILIENGVIETELGQNLLCNQPRRTVGRCDCCETIVIFNLTGKHTYNAASYVKPTCEDDGYTPCAACGTPYVDTTKDMAAGHTYAYVTESIDTVNMTADFRCSTCQDFVDDFAIEYVDTTAALDCKSYPMDNYTAALDNGLAPTHRGNDGNINYVGKVDFSVADTTAPLQHVLTKVGVYNITKLVSDTDGRVASSSDIIKALSFDVEEGGIDWELGEAANCGEYKRATFRCSCCNKMVIISLQGAHSVPADAEQKTVQPSCDVYGYKYYECTAGCHVDIEVIDINGHNFAIVDKAAFLADVEADTVSEDYAYAFKCATCGDTYNAKYVSSSQSVASPCQPNPTTTYNFTLKFEATYPTINGEVYAPAEEIEVAVSCSNTVEVVSHRVEVGEVSIDDIDPAQLQISNNDWIVALASDIEVGGVDWELGVPADCTKSARAVFRCADCEKIVIISLTGSHILDGKDVVTAPECLKGGKTVQHCTVANCPAPNKEIVLATTEALGHDYAWTFTGEVVYDADGNVDAAATLATASAVAECSRCDAEYDGSVEMDYAQNCCHVTELTFKYFEGQDLVGTKKVQVQPNGAHEYTVSNPTDETNPAHGGPVTIVIREVVEIEGDYIVTTTYTAKWCYAGQCYVEQTPIVTREAIPQA